MINIRTLGGLLALVLTIAACATDTGPEAQEVDAAAATESILNDEPVEGGSGGAQAAASALLGTSPAGDIIVGPEGLALYGFTNDVEAASTCYGTCADAWPPVLVEEGWNVGPGLDTGIFATTVRDDGQLQLVAGKWPLYYYAGDAAPGDINGQGSGDVWFLVDPAGSLITDAAPTDASGEAADAPSDEAPAGGAAGPVAPVETDLGQVLADDQGLTLYGFTNDTDGVPSCYDDCADAWPPHLLDGPELPADLDPAVYSVAERDDGSHQLVAGIWPLYRFAGDAGPGDINGQGSGDVWFAVGPNAKLIGADGAVGGSDSESSDSDSADSESDPYGY